MLKKLTITCQLLINMNVSEVLSQIYWYILSLPFNICNKIPHSLRLRKYLLTVYIIYNIDLGHIAKIDPFISHESMLIK